MQPISTQVQQERVILVHIVLPSHRDAQEQQQEFVELFSATGLSPVDCLTYTLRQLLPQYLIGTGKVEELKMLVQHHQAQLVIFNYALSPGQERNLEKALSCRVIDRSGLILDIFARRARTAEGKLQVELAQLKHLSTRLIRGWTHLERQKGGIGLRGPGETQLEVDRRLIRQRIMRLTQRLEEIKKNRSANRSARKKKGLLTVALVGYTNAGKSSLFNRLTGSDVYAANLLFATLDPTVRSMHLPPLGDVILADTVGFIRDLPHDLIAAFRATLEEVCQSDLLIHVIDATHPQREDQIHQVELVLQEINADRIPRLQFFNKIDLLTELEPKIDVNSIGDPFRIWGSVFAGQGIDLLKQAIIQTLQGDLFETEVYLTSEQSKLRSELYQLGAVLKERYDDSGNSTLNIRLNKVDFDRLFH